MDVVVVGLLLYFLLFDCLICLIPLGHDMASLC